MQQRDEFEWDDDNEDKLAARHGVGTAMRPKKLPQILELLSNGSARTGSATPSTSSWVRQTRVASCSW